MELPIIIFSLITLELDFLQSNIVYFKNISLRIKGTVCTLISLSAMLRVCCNNFICQSTINSSVNHRHFSVINRLILIENQKMLNIYSLAAKVVEECNLLERPNGSLKQGLRNICLVLKQTKSIDTFLYKHFRRAGHS